MPSRDQAGSTTAVLPAITYKPGWSFKIGGPGNRYLCVMATTLDSFAPNTQRCTQHMFLLPDPLPASRHLARWVFDQLLLCELHEAGEFFQWDGSRPFFPNHQDEGSPYELVDRWEQ
jgi:hypothetical protein